MGFFKEVIVNSVKEAFDGVPYVSRCDVCNRMTNQVSYYRDGIKYSKCYKCGTVWKSYY